MNPSDIDTLLEQELSAIASDDESDSHCDLVTIASSEVVNDLSDLECLKESSQLILSSFISQDNACHDNNSGGNNDQNHYDIEAKRAVLTEFPNINSLKSCVLPQLCEDISAQLTEEDSIVISELMDLMVESVERCAVIIQVSPTQLHSAPVHANISSQPVDDSEGEADGEAEGEAVIEVVQCIRTDPCTVNGYRDLEQQKADHARQRAEEHVRQQQQLEEVQREASAVHDLALREARRQNREAQRKLALRHVSAIRIQCWARARWAMRRARQHKQYRWVNAAVASAVEKVVCETYSSVAAASIEAEVHRRAVEGALLWAEAERIATETALMTLADEQSKLSVARQDEDTLEPVKLSSMPVSASASHSEDAVNDERMENCSSCAPDSPTPEYSLVDVAAGVTTDPGRSEQIEDSPEQTLALSAVICVAPAVPAMAADPRLELEWSRAAALSAGHFVGDGFAWSISSVDSRRCLSALLMRPVKSTRLLCGGSDVLDAWTSWRRASTAQSHEPGHCASALLAPPWSASESHEDGGAEGQELRLDVEDLHCLPNLQHRPWVRRLSVNVNKISSLAGVEHLVQLHELSACDNLIADLAEVRGLSSLRVLRVDSNRLSDLSPLGGLRHLAHLSANMNKLTRLPNLINCVCLQRLELNHNSIIDISIGSIGCLPSSLTYLDLSANRMRVLSGSVLSACGLLQSLVLSQNALREPPAPLHLPLLRDLYLNKNAISSWKVWQPAQNFPVAAAAAVDWPLFAPMLRRMFLQDNQIATLGSAVLSTLPLLRELDLSFNSVRSRADIAPVCEALSLHTLHLQDNPLTASTGATDEADRRSLFQWTIDRLPNLKVLSGVVVAAADRTKINSTGTPIIDLVDERRRTQSFVQVLSFIESDLSSLAALQKHSLQDGLRNRVSLDVELGVLDMWRFRFHDSLRAHLKSLIDFSEYSSPCAVGAFVSYSKQTGQKPTVVHLPAATIKCFLPSAPAGCTSMESLATPVVEESDRVSHSTRAAAATTLQRVFRGIRGRREVRRLVLASAYDDPELDLLLNAPGESDALLQAILTGGPEDGIGTAEPTVTKASPESSMVFAYGDLIKRRSREAIRCSSARGSSSLGNGWMKVELESDRPTAMATNTVLGSRRFNVDQETIMGQDFSESPRPSSVCSVASSRSVPSHRGVSSSGAGLRLSEQHDGFGISAAQLARTHGLLGPAEEWSTAHTSVLGAFGSQTKQLHQKDVEHPQEPLYHRGRLRPAQKSAGGGSNSSGVGGRTVSGSFGGKPAIKRKATKKPRRPGWLTGSGAHGSESEEENT